MDTIPIVGGGAEFAETLRQLIKTGHRPCSTPGCTGTGDIEAVLSDDADELWLGLCVTCPCGDASSEFHPVLQLPASAIDMVARFAMPSTVDVVRAAGIPVPDPVPVPQFAGLEISEPDRYEIVGVSASVGPPARPGFEPFAVTIGAATGSPVVWWRRPAWDDAESESPDAPTDV